MFWEASTTSTLHFPNTHPRSLQDGCNIRPLLRVAAKFMTALHLEPARSTAICLRGCLGLLRLVVLSHLTPPIEYLFFFCGCESDLDPYRVFAPHFASRPAPSGFVLLRAVTRPSGRTSQIHAMRYTQCRVCDRRMNNTYTIQMRCDAVCAIRCDAMTKTYQKHGRHHVKRGSTNVSIYNSCKWLSVT